MVYKRAEHFNVLRSAHRFIHNWKLKGSDSFFIMYQGRAQVDGVVVQQARWSIRYYAAVSCSNGNLCGWRGYLE
ncbi:MAG: hypothetical protein OI74_07340 [Gammaproteobacteria bacterium (ex Lamellibrachia satsuma)]|nr:MAG: hypothetical protein OI74_07340 [Gammaproteobacteria bacterium (ex Lamellibrachia satsuma)]